MNDYLIDPMFFYWIGVVDAVIVFSACMAATFFFAACGFIFVYVKMKFDEDDNYVRAKIPSIIFTILFVIFSSIAIFIPSKEILIQMAVAKQVTYTNINKAEEKIKNAIDYIFEKVNNYQNNGGTK